MTDSVKKEMRGSVDITCDNNPGDILVEVIRNVFSKAATVVATATCEKVFSGGVPVEDIVFAINARGLELKIGGVMEIMGHTSEKGEIDPPAVLAEVVESVKVRPGMLQTMEVEDETPPEGERH
jgi:hypothetical protein